MAKLSRKTAILAKVEAVAGTDILPVVSEDAMLVFGDGAAVYSQETNQVDDPALRDSLTQNKLLVGRTLGRMTIGTKLMTSQGPAASAGDIAANLPWFDPLLRGCGLSSTTGDNGSSSSSTVYTPVSTSFATLTLKALADGVLYAVLGGQGSFTLDMQAGAAPNLNFDFSGEYLAPSDYTAGVTNPPYDQATIDYPADNKSLVQSEAFTIDPSGTPFVPTKVRSINLNWANTISEQPDANDTYGHGGSELTARGPTLTVQFSVPNDGLATYDPYTDLYDTSPSKDVTWVHSTSATDKVRFTLTTPQLINVDRADTGGVTDFTLTYRLWSDTDDGELTIAFEKSVS